MCNKKILYSVGFLMTASLLMNPVYSQQNNQNSYDYCQNRAEQVSGYYGPTPRENRSGGALKGALGGAALGALFGDSKKAAGRDAALGALFGGIKRAQAQKDEDRQRRAYQFELDACMSSGN